MGLSPSSHFFLMYSFVGTLGVLSGAEARVRHHGKNDFLPPYRRVYLLVQQSSYCTEIFPNEKSYCCHLTTYESKISLRQSQRQRHRYQFLRQRLVNGLLCVMQPSLHYYLECLVFEDIDSNLSLILRRNNVSWLGSS